VSLERLALPLDGDSIGEVSIRGVGGPAMFPAVQREAVSVVSFA
jgi:hypothetical protein